VAGLLGLSVAEITFTVPERPETPKFTLNLKDFGSLVHSHSSKAQDRSSIRKCSCALLAVSDLSIGGQVDMSFSIAPQSVISNN